MRPFLRRIRAQRKTTVILLGDLDGWWILALDHPEAYCDARLTDTGLKNLRDACDAALREGAK